jgi:hypothetical protein
MASHATSGREKATVNERKVLHLLAPRQTVKKSMQRQAACRRHQVGVERGRARERAGSDLRKAE